ncbi:hypothetical protein NMY22_g6109 [Coprinellus aureogranulatus]|nr:hypothetical protein NMY22_g6109 [Coprinellus aureogranulatus]
MSTTYFSSAHDLQIQNLTISHHTVVDSRAFDHLHNHIAGDALHNSDERCDAPKCYPETRKAVQQDIYGWITHEGDDSDGGPPKILWLTGPAGAGKTAIAGSIAETCDDEGILTHEASFDRNVGLLPTTARCLTAPPRTILSSVERDPYIFRKTLSAQCKALAFEPVPRGYRDNRALVPPQGHHHHGLDEVEAPNSRQLEPHEARQANEIEQNEILSALFDAVCEPRFPFRVLIVSRPERNIRDFFSQQANQVTRSVFLDDSYNPDSDIQLFLEAKFSDFRRRYKLPVSWPGDSVLAVLRNKASGQFIYAATVVRFLFTRTAMSPQARLDCLMQSQERHTPVSGTFFSPLDEIYARILRSSPDPILSTRLLGALHFLRRSASFLRQLLQESPGQVDYLLEYLSSLVSIPEDGCLPHVFHHRSLIDFLENSERSSPELWKSFETGKRFANTCCVHVLKAKSTAVPLTASEWQAFLPNFLDTLLIQFSPPDDGSGDDDLAACDVLWWVQTVVDTDVDEPISAVNVLGRIFDVIHHKCPASYSHHDCRQSCKHWRSKILAGCNALGWRIPNAVVLLRERMLLTVPDSHTEIWGFLPEAYFEPRSPPACPTSVLALEQEPVPLNPHYDDYASMCRLAESMYARLPCDWEERYRGWVNAKDDDDEEGNYIFKTPYNALRSEIRSIVTELGLELEDIDVSEMLHRGYNVRYMLLLRHYVGSLSLHSTVMSTSYLTNAHDFQIHNLTINHQMAVASKAYDHLHDNIAADALHNSDKRCDAPKCHPETRKAVQQDIRGWIGHGDDDEEPQKILWLSGPAGSGKTAIAGSIAEACDDEGILAGTFFFSSFAGSESRQTKRCLIATLAYCFLQHDSLQPLRAPILSAIERDPSIFCKSLSAQCKTLLMKPFQVTSHLLGLSFLPKVIIIDALDEVEAPGSRQLEAQEARRANEKEQVEILSVLLQAARNPHFPFRIVIVSRPEPVIRDFFADPVNHVAKDLFLDDKYDPDSDIELFLRAQFNDIRRRYRLSISWPGEEVFKALRDESSGQFIYATTVVRFLETAKGHPQARLDNLITTDWGSLAVNAKALSPLDALYTHILNSGPEPESSVRWLGAIHDLHGRPALFVRQLLQEYEGQAEYHLENLASLIHIPTPEAIHSPFEFHHKSLLDFLKNEERCGHDLNASFLEGSDTFIHMSLVRVLRDKSPAHPLNDSDWKAFLEDFLLFLLPIYMRPSLPRPLDGEFEEALFRCDALWWVRAVDATLCDHPWSASHVMAIFFFGVHAQCNELPSGERSHSSCWHARSAPCQGTQPCSLPTGTFDRCRPACKHWRSKILGGCKALGWRVPNAIAFLRERMSETISQGALRLSNYFKCPDPTSRSPARPACPPRTEPVSLESYYDDYESMCRLGESMYDLLPADWEKRYREGLKTGDGDITEYNALRSEISQVCRVLGVNLRDVDPFAEPSLEIFHIGRRRLAG